MTSNKYTKAQHAAIFLGLLFHSQTQCNATYWAVVTYCHLEHWGLTLVLSRQEYL